MTSVSDAIMQRHSVREFRADIIDIDIIIEILEKAKRAPSNCNHQPWKVYVLTGSKKDELSNAVIEDFEKKTSSPNYPYLPSKWIAPYSTRRQEIGFLLYDTIGIEYDEKEKLREHHKHNFEFYGAPVGIIFTIDSSLQYGSFLDYGMFLQNINLLCQEKGLSTCNIGFFVEYPNAIVSVLNLKPNERIVCGLAIGYENKEAIINSVKSDRESLETFVTIL